ncbi:polysialyltransferase family glycosyltransferase [Hydrogenovibrio sp. 3SP14C1]|uniref:polysialyltransferase family glycosyltransferase n=1 Tax=Hydrogenovibrio sp. 3SP14C1 TaxID=3038774 RepID=UPI002418101F|nr:polysialyltransferase family glycosyltransferase [Hydrogenovibrio sp. 3SP14C1]MDG4813384.1 polysialyltransferase family glycosyltransferase [Hydrogenovibrio sp. 3SP14C1]
MNNHQICLYVPSTPFNLLLSFIDALGREENCILVFIDQKFITPYVSELEKLSCSPFKKVFSLYGKASGIQKLKERKSNFKFLQSLIDEYDIREVVAGSDRRIEFQFVVHQLTLRHKNITASYLDDGLYSYLAWQRSWLKYTVNSLIKKLFYGLWWREPHTPGCSSYINQSILISPEKALSCLINRKVKKLDLSQFNNSCLKSWTAKLLDSFQCDVATVSNMDVCFILPHPNDIKKMPNYVDNLKSQIQRKIAKGQIVGVKYHPRFEDQDLFGLKQFDNVMILPSALAFEFLIPFLKYHAYIIGDYTTVMLTAKMLRNDLNVIANIETKNDYERPLLSVMKLFDVTVVNKT